MQVMQAAIERVEKAINYLQSGKMLILTDNPDRENEGDLICAAEMSTNEDLAFMIKHGSGIVCLSMLKDQLENLSLPLMVDDNTSFRGTPFTVSIDAKYGISTGVSAADRVHTIKAACNKLASKNDLVRPGHIFPLQANEQGVFARAGHTEGSVDLMKLAGLTPAAVLCEIMNPDGTMTKGEALFQFAEDHQLHVLSIDDIILYRLRHENLIAEKTTAILPIHQYGEFNITIIKDSIFNQEHIILEKESRSSPLLVRVHSSCITGDLFSSLRCDCHQQLHFSLEKISKEGGMLIYLNQEGRGIGLFNKIKAYALQEQGYDTVEANTQLGLPADSRNYSIAASILREKNVDSVRLLTNNLGKVQSLIDYGISIVHRETMPVFNNDYNIHYLQTKKMKLNHDINIG